MTDNVESITKKKKKINKGFELNLNEAFQLMELIKNEYASLGLSDNNFAKYALTKLNLRPGITLSSAQISSRRAAFGIPSNRHVAKALPTSDELQALVMKHELTINALQERVTMLEGWINTTFPSKSGKKAI